MRILRALSEPLPQEKKQIEVEAEILCLGQKLVDLEESASNLKDLALGSEETKKEAEGVAEEILAQLQALLAEAEADQAEVEELQRLEKIFRAGEEELVPEMEYRKAVSFWRLEELKASIAVFSSSSLPFTPPPLLSLLLLLYF